MATLTPLDINETLRQLENLLEQEPLLNDKLISCRTGSPKTPWEQEQHDIIAEQNAPGELYKYLQRKYLNSATARPSVMTAKVFQAFINQNRGNILPTNIQIPPHVLDNTTRMVSEKLLNKTGTSKQSHSKGGITRRPYNEVMSFNNIRNEVFSGFIKKIIKKNKLVGRNNTTLRTLEGKISNNIPLTLDEMYMLIHEHIMSEYSEKAASITNSAQLLAFIRTELMVLSQLVSDIYPHYLRMIDFAIYNTYSPLLIKYIELILQQNNFVHVGNYTEIAESIKTIVFQHICPFFQEAGNPVQVIRQSMIADTKKYILEGARLYLSQHGVQAQGAAGAIAAEGGNRRRIKKYKNRSSRRSSRRTTRITKYRTNRYKIKNKKTRKIR